MGFSNYIWYHKCACLISAHKRANKTFPSPSTTIVFIYRDICNIEVASPPRPRVPTDYHIGSTAPSSVYNTPPPFPSHPPPTPPTPRLMSAETMHQRVNPEHQHHHHHHQPWVHILAYQNTGLCIKFQIFSQPACFHHLQNIFNFNQHNIIRLPS